MSIKIRVLIFNKKREGNWLLVNEFGIFDVEFCLKNPELVVIQSEEKIDFNTGYTLLIGK